MDESRKAFESWCKTVMTDDADFCMEWGHYSNINVRLRWEAWKASRAAIEIELPLGATKDDVRLRHETSHEGSFNLCLYWVHKAIHSAGIKIKE